MTIPYSLAEHLQSAIGHDIRKETHHLGANGTVHMDAGVTMYLPKGSECPQRIGFAHIQENALWLQTYAKMTYMIPIENEVS